MNKDLYLRIIKSGLQKGDITLNDIKNLVAPLDDQHSPEAITNEFIEWYKKLGIESLTEKTFTLTPCPFTKEEIQATAENEEIIIAVPGKVHATQLAQLFHIKSVHDLNDKLIQHAAEPEDTWVKISANDIPIHLNKVFKDIEQDFETQNKIIMSLPKYIVFAARFFQKHKKFPDLDYWNYLSTKYDKSGVIIAGFDSKNKALNVHGWKKNHPHETWLGSRCCEHAKRIEIREETKF